MEEKEVGIVFDYFSQPKVAAIKVSGDLSVGDRIQIKGHTTDFEMTINSMQINREEVEEVGVGQSVGIKVSEKVRSGDKVYKVSE